MTHEVFILNDEMFYAWDVRFTAVEEHRESYPVILSSEGRIMDGMHRVLKVLNQGESHIRAVRFTADPEPDFVGVDPDELQYDEEPTKDEQREI
jgi:hypothetical protein